MYPTTPRTAAMAINPHSDSVGIDEARGGGGGGGSGIRKTKE